MVLMMMMSMLPSSRQRMMILLRREATPTRRYLGIGRMLDMGGMPSAANDQSPIRAVNASKNSKLQAVAFDFEVLTRSIEASEKKEKEASTNSSSSASIGSKMAPVQPDLDSIQQVASLMGVDVDTGKGGNTTSKSSSSAKPKVDLPPNQDIRAKYANKLKGGLAGLELAKSQVESSLGRGDAAGHLAARKKAVNETAATPTKWMALTGTGKLLSYLTHRSIRIALLPNPKLAVNDRPRELDSMEQFKRQMKDVVVDAIVKINDDDDDAATTTPADSVTALSKMLNTGVLKELNDMHPNHVLIVSDQDHYLRAARELGMITCRIRPLNARRGNVTTHYSATSVPEVQEVINEINGISFNAVLNR